MLKCISKDALFVVWILLGLLCILLTVFMYFHPSVFPMHGFTGPVDYVPLLSHIRLTGDSWRYLRCGYGGDFSCGYLGYCLLVGVFGSCIVFVQAIGALAGLWALVRLGGYCFDARWDGRGRLGLCTALLCGGAYALNLENGAWHCAVMTESLYMSMVCVVTWLAFWAQRERQGRRMPVAACVTILTCFLRPTGWILLPAVLVYWCFTARWLFHRKVLVSLCVLGCFLTGAFFCSSGINSEGPTAKLYSGEVVWQEDLWRVEMPEPSDATKTGIADGLLYGLCHPVMSGWLVMKRLCVMLLRIRPGYSTAHNIFLLLFHFPVALLGMLSFVVNRRNRAVMAVLAMVLAHSLVVGLTFNDNDGRFTLYFTPVLVAAASALLVNWAKKIIGAICKN